MQKKLNIIIGKNGSEIDKLKKAIEKMISLNEVYINIHEVRKFNIDAAIVAQTGAWRCPEIPKPRNVVT